MANISLNVILIWTGTNASIPSGWVRETSLDAKFPKAAANGVAGNVTGGADSHSHTSPAHSHTMISHNHTGSVPRSQGDFETEGGGSSAARDAHYHDYNITGVAGGTLNDAISYQAIANNSLPPFHEVIFIRPTGAPKPLENGIVALFSKTTIPTGWQLCNGTSSPDLRNKYLRGAGTGADAGTTGGATTHSHTVDHTHAAVTHTHSGTTGYDSDQSGSIHRDTWSGGGQAVDHHTHTVTLIANSAETASTYTGTAGSAETVEPLYKKLCAIKNNTGNPSKPKDIIGMWLGALADIPKGWIICDGTQGTVDMTGYHLKIANDTSEIGNTGGANTHSHAASNSHTHTAPGTHTHGDGTTDHFTQNGTTTANSNGVSKPHSHYGGSGFTCSANTSSWNAATIQADSSNNEPAYRTVTFIQYKRELIGGLILMQMAG